MDKRFDPQNMGRLDTDSRRKLIPPDTLISMININEGDTVLDVGAGTGYFAIPALEYVGSNGKVIAADISQEMLTELRRKLPADSKNLSTIRCDADKIPLPDKTADKILMAFVFHEFGDKKQYLCEIGRLVKGNGQIIIVEWEKVQSPMGPPLDDRISYSELMHIAESAGFLATRYNKINEDQYLVILEKK